jgi:hypothetical protein
MKPGRFCTKPDNSACPGEACPNRFFGAWPEGRIRIADKDMRQHENPRNGNAL